MKFLLVLSAILALTFGGISDAQEYDGRMWRAVSDRDNGTYILGFLNGIRVGGGEILGVKISKTLTPLEYVEEINSFYSDPKNRILPVTAVVAIVSAAANGAKPEDIQNLIADARKIYSKHDAP